MSTQTALTPAVYAALSREEKLRWLSEMHQKVQGDKANGFLEGRMLEVTIGMEDHPYWYAHNCLCDRCQGFD